ncbi:MAG TPA: osmotically inducible protein OsmC [Desulfuromonadales bacterium]|nr:osmotically inducible protein OsmC [Desulfuromonadales bacterium]
MEVIKITLDGGRKVTAHLNDGRQVTTDQPVAEGGTNAAPTPFDIFLASLATCAGVYVTDFCNHRNIPTDTITLTQSADFTVDDKGKHVLAAVSLTIHLPNDFPEKYREAVVRVAELCAVKRAIVHPPQFSVQLG